MPLNSENQGLDDARDYFTSIHSPFLFPDNLTMNYHAFHRPALPLCQPSWF